MRPLTVQVAQPTKSWLVSWPMSMAKVCRTERLNLSMEEMGSAALVPHVVMRWSVNRGQGPVDIFGVVCYSRMLEESIIVTCLARLSGIHSFLEVTDVDVRALQLPGWHADVKDN